jgi:hypothetical protein
LLFTRPAAAAFGEARPGRDGRRAAAGGGLFFSQRALLGARRRRCAALRGEGRGAARGRAARRQFQSCQTEAVFDEDAGRGLRFFRLCRSKYVIKIVDAACGGQRVALWGAQRLCSAARRLASGLPKSTSADRKTRQAVLSHVETNVHGPEKDVQTPGNEPELTPSIDQASIEQALHDVKRCRRSLQAIKKHASVAEK